jgi:acyl carrier protein
MEMDIRVELAKLLEVDLGSLQNQDTKLESFENWDSLTKVSLVALFEEKTGRLLETNEIDKFVTVGDLLRLTGNAK